MKKRYSFCGLACVDCPAWLARQKNDYELRVKTAKDWAEEFEAPDLKPEDINCLGCWAEKEPVYRHCRECEVRLCALEMKVENCGLCDDYKNCQKIGDLLKMIPEAKKVCESFVRKVKS